MTAPPWPADPLSKPAKARRWRRWALEALLLVLLIAGVRAWQHRDAPSGAAPALAGTLLDGRPFNLAGAGDGPTLVHFWATWCAICSAEQGSVESIARDHRTITIAMQSGPDAAVARHLAKEGLSFPVLNDADGGLSARWGVRAVPATYVVDAKGRIRFLEVGYSTGLGLRLRLWWAGLSA